MKKFFTYILIFVTVLQLVIPPSPAQAESPTDKGDCAIPGATMTNVTREFCKNSGGTFKAFGSTTTPVSTESPTDKGDCAIPGATMTNVTREFCKNSGGTFKAFGSTTTGGPGGTLGDTGSAAAPGDAPKDPNADIFGSCSGWNLVVAWNVTGCVVRAFHLVFMVLPSMVLYLTAYIFNAMLALTLGTVLYKNGFLPEAWRIVRDFSNIFFILVLLYISIKMILGLGGAEVKKMIAQVIVAALLINFSMFMTQVVIDASNMLALIFYNKIQVTSQTYTPFISTKNGVQDKDIAGAIASGFNPAKFINPADVAEINNKAVTSGGLFYDLKNIAKDPSTTINPLRPLDNTTTNLKIGWAVAKSALTGGGDEKTFPPSIALAIIFTACAVYLFASYAFFIAGLAFIGRLIELWMLIIFSPFAFMSLSVPKLKGIEYLGWDAWLKRLLAVAFMAPVFMFFLLLISKLVQINIFKGMENIPGQTPITIPHVLVMLIIPAIIYISLLWKAVDYAKKGAGEFGSAIIKYGQMAAVAVGGLAVGAATGGVGLAASSTLGSLAAKTASSSSLLKASTQKGIGGWAARMTLKGAEYGANASFDARKLPGVGGMMKKMGMKTESSTITKALGLSSAGGYEGRKKRMEEEREKREKQLKVRGSDPLMHELHKEQENLQSAENKVAECFRQIDDEIETWESKKRQAVNGSADDVKAAEKLKELNELKGSIKAGVMPMVLKYTEGAFKGEFKDANGNYNTMKEKDQTGKMIDIYATSNGKIAEKAVEEYENKVKDGEKTETEAENALTEAQLAIKAIKESEVKAKEAADARKKAEEEQLARPTSTDANNALKTAIENETKALKELEDNKEKAPKLDIKELIKNHESAKTKLSELRSKLEITKEITKGGTGASIKEMKNIIIPGIKTKIRDIENSWKWAEADRIEGKMLFKNINHELAHKMRMAADVTEVKH